MVRVNDLASEIARQVELYTDGVKKDEASMRKKIAKDAVAELKAGSPELTGGYAKGWKVSNQGTESVIHNETNYQLTHLLEKGHANRDGGRTAPQVHIAPVEETLIERYLDGVERIIRG